MTLFFKKEFKDKVLSGEKYATIRNSKHLNVGTVFNVNIGTRFAYETIGKAKCIDVDNFKDYPKATEVGTLILPTSKIEDERLQVCGWVVTAWSLGFNTAIDAQEFYKKTLKDGSGYYHRFELIKE